MSCVLSQNQQGSSGVRFRVGDEWRTYSEGRASTNSTESHSSGKGGDGKSIIFDDSFEHEVRISLHSARQHILDTEGSRVHLDQATKLLNLLITFLVVNPAPIY